MGHPRQIKKERPALGLQCAAIMPQTRQNAITQCQKTYAIGQAL
jgi:hypothetical protein